MALRRIELPGDPWQYATWEGASRAQLLAGAQLGLREKLEWLEQAAELVERLGRGRESAGRPSAVGSSSRTAPRRIAAQPSRRA